MGDGPRKKRNAASSPQGEQRGSAETIRAINKAGVNAVGYARQVRQGRQRTRDRVRGRARWR